MRVYTRDVSSGSMPLSKGDIAVLMVDGYIRYNMVLNLMRRCGINTCADISFACFSSGCAACGGRGVVVLKRVFGFPEKMHEPKPQYLFSF